MCFSLSFLCGDRVQVPNSRYVDKSILAELHHYQDTQHGRFDLFERLDDSECDAIRKSIEFRSARAERSTSKNSQPQIASHYAHAVNIDMLTIIDIHVADSDKKVIIARDLHIGKRYS